MDSNFDYGHAYINLSEQTNSAAIVADGIIDESELLSMSLMYEGNETTVSQLLAATEGNVKVSVICTETDKTNNLKIGEMSANSEMVASLTTGITSEELYSKFLGDMIMDEIRKQFKDIASQGIGEYSYDRIYK